MRSPEKKYGIQNRRYLGNKYKLLPFIRETIDRECGEFASFFDVFSGTGAVASAFLDKKIITNDLLYSNHLSHIAWFHAAPYDAKKLESIIAYYNSLQNLTDDNYMSLNFADTFFSKAVCRKIGFIREDIEARHVADDINDKEYAILITSLLYSMDKIAKTCGHYDAFRRGVELEQDIQMAMLDIPKNPSKKNEFYNCDSNQLARSVACDVAYLDPPYNSRQYGDAYHLLENVAKWEKPEVFGVAKKMNRDHIKSEYCLSSASDAFADLVQHLNCKYIVLSYNNTGDSADGRSNARISDEDIMRILSAKGDVKVFTKKYKAFSAGKSQNDKNEERLFICTVHNQPIVKSPLNYTGGKAKLLPQILPLFPFGIDCFVDMFCGGCNVGINVRAQSYIYNDKNELIVSLFKYMKNYRYAFPAEVHKVIQQYNLSESHQNGYECYGCTSADGLGAYNKEPYQKLKSDFNARDVKDLTYYAMFYVLIVFAFNNQIRFNSSGEFNLPVGKRDFNTKMQQKLVDFIGAITKQNSTFTSKDFAELEIPDNAFVYCDPPYLITTASYNENGGWTETEERRLLDVLDGLTARGIKFALSNVLEHNGRKNQILIDWIARTGARVTHLDFNYNNSNYQSKSKNGKTDEVLITNY